MQQRRKGNGPLGVVCLGRDEAQRSRDPLQCLDHFQRGGFDAAFLAALARFTVECAALAAARPAGHELDVLPPQAEQLPTPQAEAERQDVQRIEPPEQPGARRAPGRR
nr:hypothetical protein GCM10010200_048590 [Actinomadura rugatobispora]